ncbi:MAG: serine/threonine-protein kinase [Polyangia bacterium]
MSHIESQKLPTETLIADRYRVLRRLGRGGMGTVYEVEHVHVGRHFALKLMDKSAPPAFEASLYHEAKLLGRLESEHVVKVIDCGRDEQHGSFLVVEKFHGGTLGELLALHGRVDWEQAVNITLSLCVALADVHRAGVVHRDLKPHNIGLTDRQFAVKLFDFGIASVVGEHAIDARLQGSGTLPYMAPELWNGASASTESDLFAVGCTLFEMLTGERPFDGKTAPLCEEGEILQAFEDVAPDAKIPGWLMQVVAKLLSRSPRNRFHGAAELAAALRRSNAYAFRSTLGIDLEEMTVPRAAIAST